MLFYFFENVTTLEICQDLHEQRLCKIPLGPCLIGHISHNRHDRRWCTFFKLVFLLASKTQSFGPIWPFLAILLPINTLFGAPFTDFNSVVVVPQINKYEVRALVKFFGPWRNI